MATVKKICPSSYPGIFTCKGDLSKTWYVEYKATDGSRVRIYKGLGKENTAEERMEIAQKIIDDLLSKNPKIGKPPMIQALYVFLEGKQHLGKKTYSQYKSRLQKFEKYYKGETFQLRDADAYLRYLSEIEKLSPTSRNDHRAFFRRAFAWLVKRKYWKINPFEDTDPIPAHTTPYRYFQKSDIKRLKRIISQRDPELWLFCQFIYYTFIRPGELRKMKVSDILWDDMKFLIRKEVSKNGKQQYVRIPQAFYPVLENHYIEAYPDHYLFSKSGGPGSTMIGTNNMGNRHRPILRESGYTGGKFVLYSWKHTGGVQFILAGGRLKALQLQMRHHSLDQTDQYVRELGVEQMPDIDLFPEI